MGEGHHRAPAHGALETRGVTIHQAGLYNSLVSPVSWLLGGGRTFAQATLELAGLAPGERVLDVGCGPGTLALAAARQVGPQGLVRGVDASPEMIAVARRKAEGAGAGVEFQVGLIEDLPFPDSEFDLVLSSLMIHHLPGADIKRRAFVEIQRVLKPGGCLLVVDFEPPAGGLLKPLLRHVLGHRMMDNDIGKLPALAEAAGFTDVHAGRTSHRLLSYVSGRAEKG